MAEREDGGNGATAEEEAGSCSAGRAIGKEEGATSNSDGGFTADDDASDGTECIICFTQYDNVFKMPKVLRCGHTFCLECLARINVSSEEINSVTCPICRNATHLPTRKGLPALDTDMDILNQLPGGLALGSVRFSRKKGLLYVKDKATPVRHHLPKPLQVSSVSLSLDVGRPAPRSRAPLGCVRGTWLFYIAVTIAVILTLGLVMSGVYIFFLFPKASSQTFYPGNSSMIQGEKNATTLRPM
ncbi:RING finger protein 225 [Rhinatrema bivittatum]|uniref:RING finger protein 225 n=1 Tax=Rhinatrema bivittatum TaxID=194408 RepID=UPI00112683D2|nr:RING finger protein 225 [Rhinatrema bivittatum]